MFKWSKVPCKLKFTIESIDLHTDIDSRFRLSWARGSASGETYIVTPTNQQLALNASFECSCKMYVSKHDNSVRPKKVKIVLNRVTEKHQEKVYGRLAVDVGEFFGKTTPTVLQKDMESGRGKAPTLNAEFILVPTGSVQNVTQKEMNDMSFIGEPEKRVALSEWDVTEMGSDESDPGKKGKKRKHKRTSDDKKSKRKDKHKKKGKTAPEEAPAPAATPSLKDFVAPRVRNFDFGSEFKRERSSVNASSHVEEPEPEQQKPEREPTPEPEPEPEPEPTPPPPPPPPPEVVVEPPKEEVKQEEPVKEKKEKKKGVFGIFKGKKKKHGEKEKPAVVEGEVPKREEPEPVVEEPKECLTPEVIEKRKEERRAEEELMAASVEYFLHAVLTHEWPEMRNPPRLIGDVMYPRTVFPIFAAILHTKLLESNNGHFESALSIIIAELPSISVPQRQKFLTTLVLVLLLTKHSFKYHFDVNKMDVLLTELMNVLKKQMMGIVQPALSRSEILVNRYCTGSFEFDELLLDFKDVMTLVRDSFCFGDEINKLMMDRFVSLLEYRFINKILENPSRFTFTNSMMWNSFLTAMENDERISMPVLRQVVSALVMASSISKQPDMADEVCPDVPKVVVTFILMNYVTDKNQPEKVKPLNFAKRCKISEIPEVLEPMSPCDDIDYSRLLHAANLTNWNQCGKDEEILHEFSYIATYAA